MKKKKNDNQIALDRTLKDMDSWGIITLMNYMFGQTCLNLDRDRNSIFKYHTPTYSDSALYNCDQIKIKFEEVYNREFRKIFNELEKKEKIK